MIDPALNADLTSKSFTIAKQMASGQMRFGALESALTVVNVRDVPLTVTRCQRSCARAIWHASFSASALE